MFTLKKPLSIKFHKEFYESELKFLLSITESGNAGYTELYDEHGILRKVKIPGYDDMVMKWLCLVAYHAVN